MPTSEMNTGLPLARKAAAFVDVGLYPWDEPHSQILSTKKKKRVRDEYFWMDTLCIPDKRGKAIRRKAHCTDEFPRSLGQTMSLVLDPVSTIHLRSEVSKLQLRVQNCLFYIDGPMLDVPRGGLPRSSLACFLYILVSTSVRYITAENSRPFASHYDESKIYGRTDESELEPEAYVFFAVRCGLWLIKDLD